VAIRSSSAALNLEESILCLMIWNVLWTHCTTINLYLRDCSSQTSDFISSFHQLSPLRTSLIRYLVMPQSADENSNGEDCNCRGNWSSNLMKIADSKYNLNLILTLPQSSYLLLKHLYFSANKVSAKLIVKGRKSGETFW